jgi:hypothetical protein
MRHHCLSFRKMRPTTVLGAFLSLLLQKIPTYHWRRISSTYGSVATSVSTSGRQIVGHIRYEQFDDQKHHGPQKYYDWFVAGCYPSDCDLHAGEERRNETPLPRRLEA